MSKETYIYQYSFLENRGCIATKLQDGFIPRGECKATSWLDAKNELGFELTPLQQQLLKMEKSC
jgi:hypothetical protein